MTLTDSDPQLFIDKIKANDELALQDLYQDNYHKVEQYVIKNSGSKAQAKDIFQDAFLAVWKNVKENRFIPQGATSIGGYLYRIAKNKWTDYLRSSKFKKTMPLHETNAAEIPEEDTSNPERMEVAMKAFSELQHSCKELLTRFYFDRLSFNEIALEYNLNPASLRNKKYRCLQQLRTLAIKDT